jgi:hypothetical protein
MTLTEDDLDGLERTMKDTRAIMALAMVAYVFSKLDRIVITSPEFKLSLVEISLLHTACANSS